MNKMQPKPIKISKQLTNIEPNSIRINWNSFKIIKNQSKTIRDKIIQNSLESIKNQSKFIQNQPKRSKLVKKINRCQPKLIKINSNQFKSIQINQKSTKNQSKSIRD